ncbi:MAG: fatty acyl-AMP ligase [Myxococcales bacterium]|nr:fatty acyl-AMP ligase [Myxococcales bacterium]MCB9552051.1 fatty acyl-AMP ligase [Myxococcales bacterium]
MKVSAADEVCLQPGLGVHPGRRDLPKDPPRARHSFSSFGEALATRGREQKDDIAFWFASPDVRTRSVTYGEMLELAEQFAATFVDAGCKRGDRVIISMDTNQRTVAAFYGCGLAGLVPVMLSLPLGAANVPIWSRKLGDAIDTVGARAVLVDSMVALAAREPVTSREGCRLLTPHKLSDARPFDPIKPDANELAYIQFTSGTTSRQKAVQITHGGLLTNVTDITDGLVLNTNDITVFWLPLFHDMGLVSSVHLPMLHGIPSVLLPPMAFVFTPRAWLWAVHYFRGTQSAAPNFAYHICAHRLADADIEGLDLSSWRRTQNGSEFIHADTVEAFQARFGPLGFNPATMSPVYGMAECVLAATFPAPGEGPVIDEIDIDRLAAEGVAAPPGPTTERARRVVAVGRPFEGHTLRIVDEEGKALPERRQGEIQLRGPSVTPGYFGDPEATAELLDGEWLRTGDLGYVADGRLYVYGRSKDLIIKAGRNYQPDGIERAAAEVEGVRAGCVAAFGVFNEDGGTEDLVVVFETRREAVDEVAQMVRQVSAAIKREVGLAPNRIVAVKAQSLPKTTSGKLRRNEVRTRLLADKLAVLAPTS